MTDNYVRVDSCVDSLGEESFIYIGIGIVASVLVSLCWWENSLQASNTMTVGYFRVEETHSLCALIIEWMNGCMDEY